VAGTRPNFMKVAPILRAARDFPTVEPRLVHTGQHYDEQMSSRFFDELGIPEPDVHLAVGSASHAVQTARIMEAFDRVLDTEAPDVVVVVGDVNSTLACALVAAKRLLPVAHVEAGLRSGDRTMPEEINRILTDHLSEYLFTTEPAAGENLRREGIPAERIHYVGNVMVDSLVAHRDRAAASTIGSRLGLTDRDYALCTLHRPGNVDDEAAAANTVRALEALLERLPVVLPLHPRTEARMREFALLPRLTRLPRLMIVPPLGYLDCLALMAGARVVLTDSGGIQEETTALGVPCLTFRETTERPITVEQGTNVVVGVSPDRVGTEVDRVLSGPVRASHRPPLWDGRAAWRVLDVLAARTGAPT
jgi:UDP-N-acetylglucosamine 2-epimerase (non-hydrolysing)